MSKKKAKKKVIERTPKKRPGPSELKVKDLARIKLLPGETLLVTVPEETKPGRISEAAEFLQKVFPDNSTLVVKESTKFEAISPVSEEGTYQDDQSGRPEEE